MAIFVGFEDNTVPGYKFYRPLYRDFVTTAHCKFLHFTRRTDIHLHAPKDADVKYLEGTVHQDDVDGLVYETTRVEEVVYPRRGTYIVGFRRLVYKNGTRGPEEKDGIHVRDIEQMTASTDEELLEIYGVLPVAEEETDNAGDWRDRGA